MHDFVSHILRRYFEATAWNEANSYLHLTSSSAAILDFPVPTGLSLSISASPTPPFFTTYRLGALPNLRAGIGYIYASTTHPIEFGKSSKDVKLKEIIERFRIVEAPRRPVSRAHGAEEEYWLGGERFVEPVSTIEAAKGVRGEGGEYLVYGCMHVPSARLDALWTKRISPTWQLIVTAVSTPPKYPLNTLQSAALASQSAYASSSSAGAKGAPALAASVDRLDASAHTLSSSSVNLSASASSAQQASSTASSSSSPSSYGLGPPGSTNLQLTLQRDTGRWFTEYSYSVDDALWGFRVLHNFGTPGTGTENASSPTTTAGAGDSLVASNSNLGRGGGEEHKARLDSPEVDADAGGGLRGRFSAGAEVFVSTVEKSAGLSTGIRFSTLPDTPHQPVIAPADGATGQGGPSQPPTVITATLNPMMGHLSTAYAARMARDVVVCSRFDFNVYSYESEWTVGAEYWLRRTGQQQADPVAVTPTLQAHETKLDHVRSVAAAATPTLSLREHASPLIGNETAENAAPDAEEQSWSLRPHSSPGSLSLQHPPTSPTSPTHAVPLAPPAYSPPPPPTPASSPPSAQGNAMLSTLLSPITGVLKARISTTSDIRLLWQGRLSNCLVSLGVKADLSPPTSSSSSSPTSSTQAQSQSRTGKMGIVKSIGLEVMYFSAAEEPQFD